MSLKKSAGIAAALLLSGSYAAMAATLSSTPDPVALEAFSASNGNIGTAASTTFAPVAVSAVVPAVTVTKVGSFLATQQVLSFTVSNAVFAAGITGNANISAAGCTIGNNPGRTVVTLSSGGTSGSSTVSYVIDTASACTSFTFTPPDLKAATGQTISIGAKLTLPDLTTNVDNGIATPTGTNGQIITFVDALKGTANTATSIVVDLASANKNVTTVADISNATTKTFVSGTITPTQVLSYLADASTRFDTPAGTLGAATGTLTLTGIPTAVTVAPTFKIGAAATITAHNAGAAIGTCSVPSGGASTCTMSNAELRTWAASATSPTVLFTVDGTTVIPSSTIVAEMKVTGVAGNSSAVDTLFTAKSIATIGTNGCAAEFGSMMGKNTPSALTTIRLTNTSQTAGKVYVTATDDKGTHSGVTQVTTANGGASAISVLDGSNLLPAGATVELLGTAIEAMTLGFDSWSGTTRGRAKVFLEATGCKAEAWMCINGTCSVVNQTGAGTDNTAIGKQSN